VGLVSLDDEIWGYGGIPKLMPSRNIWQPSCQVHNQCLGRRYRIRVRFGRMAMTTLNHETLGRMRGLLSEDGKTMQYRGIKYASIPGRWKDPILENKKLAEGGAEFNATRHGPSCPQHPAGFAYDLSLIGNVSLKRENEELSEFECLNLIVVVPVELDKKHQKLPVMVWYIS